MKREMLDTVDAALKRFENEPDHIELEPHEMAHDLLRKVYRDKRQPMARRIRCAIEAMQYETPKLATVAVGHMTGQVGQMY
jgi:hypothetical protein